MAPAAGIEPAACGLTVRLPHPAGPTGLVERDGVEPPSSSRALGYSQRVSPVTVSPNSLRDGVDSRHPCRSPLRGALRASKSAILPICEPPSSLRALGYSQLVSPVTVSPVPGRQARLLARSVCGRRQRGRCHVCLPTINKSTLLKSSVDRRNKKTPVGANQPGFYPVRKACYLVPSGKCGRHLVHIKLAAMQYRRPNESAQT